MTYTEAIPPRRIGLKDLQRRAKAAGERLGRVKVATFGVTVENGWSPEEAKRAAFTLRVAETLHLCAKMDLEIRAQELNGGGPIVDALMNGDGKPWKGGLI